MNNLTYIQVYPLQHYRTGHLIINITREEIKMTKGIKRRTVSAINDVYTDVNGNLLVDVYTTGGDSVEVLLFPVEKLVGAKVELVNGEQYYEIKEGIKL